jgi:glycosyltransferase involved in cell wall biosynthesis
MPFKLLSVIIPAYNERENLPKLLAKVDAVELPFGIKKEVVVVDDGSTDGTREFVASLPKRYVSVLMSKNSGKGAAIRAGLEKVTGEYVIIQDADLEYDPEDYVPMVKAVVEKDLKVLYGSRRLKRQNQYSHLSFLLGGVVLSILTNVLYRQRLTDEPTCYKLVETRLIKSLDLECERFEFCPEVTAKVARLGYRIPEVPIRYYPRSIEEGKKIRWFDGWEAIVTLWKWRRWKPVSKKSEASV